MACPTCDHTMENIGSNERADNFFLCPRCGTIKVDGFGQHGDKVYVPKLVERCRQFEKESPATRQDGAPLKSGRLWKRLGIAESINKPEDRPT